MPMIRVRAQGRPATGWRTWLHLVPMVLAAAFIAVGFGSKAFGFALTPATALLYALPIALVLAVPVALLRSRRLPETSKPDGPGAS